MAEDTNKDRSRPPLKVRRVNLDTGRENVVVISRHSSALRPDVFRGFSRVELRVGARVLLATLLITDDDALVGPDEIGLSEPAFRRFAEPAGRQVTVSPAASPESLDAVRAKIHGRTLTAAEIEAIIGDLTHYRYSDMEIAAFLIGSVSFMTSGELLALVKAMASAGTQLKWPSPVIVDKHCIGGIPGNRTSMIVVPIVAAHGLTIPKTSSRAITSPAGTADTMEVLARVDVGVGSMALHCDDGFRAHRQLFVRRLDRKVHDAVAEVIDAFELLARHGVDFNTMRAHRLPRRRARLEMRELARVRHRIRIDIAGRVNDAIGDRIRHDRVTTRAWPKRRSRRG